MKWAISIHALREEGDDFGSKTYQTFLISIHALREEGDVYGSQELAVREQFQSTPSARRATCS